MTTIVSVAVGAAALACAAWLVARHRDSPALDPVWALLARLPPVQDRLRPRLAAALAFVLGGIGLALYFRTVPDIVVGILFLLALGLASSSGPTTEDASLAWWYWLFAALAGLYALVRAESSNRRLAVEEADAQDAPAPAP